MAHENLKKILLEHEKDFFVKHYVFHLRITYPEADLGQTYEAYKDCKFLIVSQENEDTNKHQHVLVGYSKSTLDTENAGRLRIRETLRKLYPELPKGNKGHSLTIARDAKKLASYVIKDGEYKYQGFTPAVINQFFLLSYNVGKFKKKYERISELLELGQITVFQYAVQLVMLKAEHNQPIYVNHLNAHLLSKRLKRGGKSVAKEFVESLPIYSNPY